MMPMLLLHAIASVLTSHESWLAPLRGCHSSRSMQQLLEKVSKVACLTKLWFGHLLLQSCMSSGVIYQASPDVVRLLTLARLVVQIDEGCVRLATANALLKLAKSLENPVGADVYLQLALTMQVRTEKTRSRLVFPVPTLSNLFPPSFFCSHLLALGLLRSLVVYQTAQTCAGELCCSAAPCKEQCERCEGDSSYLQAVLFLA